MNLTSHMLAPAAGLFAFLPLAAPAAAHDGAPPRPPGPVWDLSWHSVDAGGGFSSASDAGGASVTLVGVVGQPDAGPARAEMSAGRFTLVGGLLPGAGRHCPADCDGSGSLEFFDFLCFQDLFARAEPEADCDESGEIDFFDFLCFQNAFAASCP